MKVLPDDSEVCNLIFIIVLLNIHKFSKDEALKTVAGFGINMASGLNIRTLDRPDEHFRHYWTRNRPDFF